MSFVDGVWTLTRESPDFTPLDFRQRFIGTFSADGNTISGAWETRPRRRRGSTTSPSPIAGPAEMSAAKTVRDIIEASRYLVLATAERRDGRGARWAWETGG